MTPKLTRKDLLCLASVVLVALAARLPLARFERLYGDEPFYAYVGHLWRTGFLPYVVVYDVKPPGLFALYAISEWISGDSLFGLWALPALGVTLTSIGIWWIGRSWFHDSVLGAAAGILYAAFSVTMAGALGASTLLMQPFVVWGLICARSGQSKSVFVGGLLLGLGVTVHQVASFEALFAFLLVAFSGDRKARYLRLFLLCCGGAVAPITYAAIYSAHGHLGDLWIGAVVSALFRTKGDGLTFGEGLTRILPLLQPALPLLAGSLLALANRDKIAPRDRSPAAFLIGWFLFSLAGIIALRAMYDHYTQTLLPPLAIGAALFLRLVSAHSRRTRLIIAPLFVALMAFPFAVVSWRSEWPNENRHVRELADAIQARVSPVAAADVYSIHEPALYLALGGAPPTRYVYVSHLLCDFPLPPGVSAEAELDRIMAQRPRFVVMRRGGVKMVCARAERLAQIAVLLARDYELVASFGADLNAVELFQLRMDAPPGPQ